VRKEEHYSQRKRVTIAKSKDVNKVMISCLYVKITLEKTMKYEELIKK